MMEAPVNIKCKLLGSIFYDKIEFDGKNYRTTSYNKVLDLIFKETKKLRGNENKNAEKSEDFSASVPRAGIEPARIAPLVFETNASTNSAIWALFLNSGAKVRHFFDSTKKMSEKVKSEK